MSGLNIFQKIAGTLGSAFKIGQDGPSIRQGTDNPGIANYLGRDGDLYIRYGSTPGLYQMIDGVWRENGTISIERTIINTATFTATNQNYYLGVNYNGSVTITLPAGTSGKSFVIKDEGAFASMSQPISITTGNGETIDGVTTFTITAPRGSVTLVFGTEWHVI